MTINRGDLVYRHSVLSDSDPLWRSRKQKRPVYRVISDKIAVTFDDGTTTDGFVLQRLDWISTHNGPKLIRTEFAEADSVEPAEQYEMLLKLEE
jgi:hypothetical protein